MHFQTLGLSLLLLSSLSFAAPGRSPAVEDFVGLEVEHIEATPNANEPLINLEREINQIESARKSGTVKAAPVSTIKPLSPVTDTTSFSTILALVFILGLPMISWIMVMNHMRKKASAESVSNIEVLEKYRQERELRNQKQDKDIKKAS